MTLKYILYKVIQTTLPYLVSIIFIVLRKCWTIEPSDFQTVGLSMRNRFNKQRFYGNSDKNSFSVEVASHCAQRVGPLDETTKFESCDSAIMIPLSSNTRYARSCGLSPAMVTFAYDWQTFKVGLKTIKDIIQTH